MRAEQGMVLVLVLIFLFVFSLLTMSILQTSLLEVKMSSNYRDLQLAYLGAGATWRTYTSPAGATTRTQWTAVQACGW